MKIKGYIIMFKSSDESLITYSKMYPTMEMYKAISELEQLRRFDKDTEYSLAGVFEI